LYEREKNCPMIVFHTSTIEVPKPDVVHSRDYLDFGKGFYVTAVKSQAINYAQRFILRGKDAFLNVYKLDDDFRNFSTKEFYHYDSEWLDFVLLCRKGMDETSFDMVKGGVADDKIFRTVDLYFAGEISKDEALRRLRFENPNNQICLRTQRVIDTNLHFISSEKL